MGRLIVALAARDPAHKLVGAVEATGMPAVGTDAGEAAGIGALGIRIGADYAAIARGFGVDRVYSFASLNELKGRFDEAVTTPGHSFIHLEVDPTSYRSHSPPMDGPGEGWRR